MKTIKRKKARFKVGDWVSFPYGVDKSFAQIIELRGPLGVNGRHMYRIEMDREFAEPDRFEIGEDDAELVPVPDKSAIIEYLKQGGLVGILQAHLINGQPAPKVWLSFTSSGKITHTLEKWRGVLGGAPIPYFALFETRVYSGRVEEVIAFLASFGLSRAEAKEVVAAVGTGP